MVISTIFIILFSLSLMGCLRRKNDDPNTEIRTLVHDSITRSYRIHVPPDTEEYTGLLLVLHGGSGTAEHMEKELTQEGFNTISDEQKFVVVYPDGIEKRWNDGRTINNPVQHIDDVGFLSVLIDNITDEFHIDAKLVFMTGISNGGQMSYKMACEKPEKIRGIAAVVSSIHERLYLNCSPSEPIPVFIIAGTQDPLVPYEGGEIRIFNQSFGMVRSMNETVQFWVQHNNCSQEPIIDTIADIDPTDGCIVTTYEYLGGDQNSTVLFYSIDGGGHTWPNGGRYLTESLVGRICYDFDACRHICDFLMNS